jgi:voltage-gated potassium channel Kch
MARGTPALVGWLGILSLLLIVTVTFGLVATAQRHADATGDSLWTTLWHTFASTFALDVPASGPLVQLALWFVLALGGIFLVSALIGLLTTGLDLRLEMLRKGRSVVVEHDHTVILGWSDQVFTVVTELVEANHSRRRSSIVILAEQDKVEMEERLRRRIGDTGRTRVVCRTGSPLDLADLAITNLNDARSIIVLAPQEVSVEDADAFVVKTLLAVYRGPAFSPYPHHVVASVRDGRNRAVAQLASDGAVIVDADDISARLVVQTARQSGLSTVYTDLLDYGGQEFYVVSEPKLAGRVWGQAVYAYRTSCLVGIVHDNGRTVLNPPMNTVIGPNDKLVLLAEDDSAVRLDNVRPEFDEGAIVPPVRRPPRSEFTLMLGWNARALKIIEQLDIYVANGSVVDIVTDRADADMALAMLSPGLRRLTVRIKSGDTRDRTALELFDITAYDNVIVLCDDRLDALTADSRVLVTLLHLRDMLAKRGRAGSIVSEMRDDRDRALAQLTRADDFVVSEQLVSLLMTQLSESPHLEAVFNDLFDPDGAELYLRPASSYLRPLPGLTFATAVEAARRRGELAIGYRAANAGEGHGIVLNPPKDAVMPAIDRLIVLADD